MVGVVPMELKEFSLMLQYCEIPVSTVDFHGKDIGQKGYGSRNIFYQQVDPKAFKGAAELGCGRVPGDLGVHGLPYLTWTRCLIAGNQAHKLQRTIENKQNGDNDADSSKIFRGHVPYQGTGISTLDYRPILAISGSNQLLVPR